MQLCLLYHGCYCPPCPSPALLPSWLMCSAQEAAAVSAPGSMLVANFLTAGGLRGMRDRRSQRSSQGQQQQQDASASGRQQQQHQTGSSTEAESAAERESASGRLWRPASNLDLTSRFQWGCPDKVEQVGPCMLGPCLSVLKEFEFLVSSRSSAFISVVCSYDDATECFGAHRQIRHAASERS